MNYGNNEVFSRVPWNLLSMSFAVSLLTQLNLGKLRWDEAVCKTDKVKVTCQKWPYIH